MIVICVYVPPRADAAAACEKIRAVTAKLQTRHPEAFMVISEDFNHAALDSNLAAFHQVVDCPTRNNRTTDLLYVNVKEAYRGSLTTTWCTYSHGTPPWLKGSLQQRVPSGGGPLKWRSP